MVVGACILHEHSSLKALWYVARNWGRFMDKRAAILKRMRVDEEYMASWFSYVPVAKPAIRFASRLQVVRSQAARAAAAATPASQKTRSSRRS